MEREFHDWLKSQSAWQPKSKVGIGDDAAVLHGFEHGEGIVVTTDAIGDGTHFNLQRHALDRIGRKALAVSLSDIAAMGATPIGALLTLMLPSDFTLLQAQEIFGGARRLADEFDVEIVGGDTNRWPGPLVISTTVIGREFSDAGIAKSWKLSGAEPGDAIVVSGSFGGSILGHHLDFQPRVELANYLVGRYTIHAATDVSDSLSLDLAAMANASCVGIELEADQVPVSAAARTTSHQSGRSPLYHALSDGEDFELILAVPATELPRMVGDLNCADALTAIGLFVSTAGFRLNRNGECEPFQPTGYSH